MHVSCHTFHQVALQKPIAYRVSFGTFAASLSLPECENILHHSLLFPHFASLLRDATSSMFLAAAAAAVRVCLVK